MNSQEKKPTSGVRLDLTKLDGRIPETRISVSEMPHRDTDSMPEKPIYSLDALKKAAEDYMARSSEDDAFLLFETFLAKLPPDPWDEQLAAMEKARSNAFALLDLSPTVKGWFRLCQILTDALDSEQIKSAPPALEYTELMLDLAADALRCESAEEALAPLVQLLNSERAIKGAAASHDGRRITREFTQGLFMQHPGEWQSLSEAAASLRERVLAESKRYSRPLTLGNAQKTITEWLSDFVRNDTSAMGKLSEPAQKRITKARILPGSR